MARSMRYPLRPSPHGGLPLTGVDAPEEALEQAIAISLPPGDTAHPWDRKAKIGAPGGTFRTPRGGGELVGFIERRFRQLEADGRAKLVARPTVTQEPDGGLRVVIQYMNLELRQLETIDRRL